MTLHEFVDFLGKTHSSPETWNKDSFAAVYITLGIVLGVKLIIDFFCAFLLTTGRDMILPILFNIVFYPLITIVALWIHPVFYYVLIAALAIFSFVMGVNNLNSNDDAPLSLMSFSLWKWSGRFFAAMDLKSRYLRNYSEHLKTNTL